MKRVLLALLLASCGDSEAPGTATLDELVELFYLEASLFGASPKKGIEYGFDTEIYVPGTAQHYNGVCMWGNPRRVVIKKSFWNSAPDWKREALVFHELGHCALDLLHNEALLPSGGPVSLMHSHITEVLKDYDELREYYLQELFQ